MARKSMGRQKVEMKKMDKESNLQVTFSKRRSGLFKKASELCTLCGAEVAIVVFSPGKKIFSFGHPGVETIVDRFLERNPTQHTRSTTLQLIEAHRNANVRELNLQLTQINNQLEIEKKRGEELSEMRKGRQSQNWWEKPIDQLDFSQLQHLKTSLEDLKRNVANQADKLQVLQNSNHPHPQLFAPNSNNNGGINPYKSTDMVNHGISNLTYGRGFNY